ncbi:D-tagatose-bisphosphate aldolase, class II, non-catalytic subunit [Nocardioides sp. T2.26MG-1]|uniref:D-tagatose-bisphosphate aldolase, class II, non-catalytic subunit n=1 Tax=Nocardioides sp. T2.26MG-1 TaxID=3041166 RepID=UPI002477799D|nr:D-tagatose-bisphosphate aldolase, class II, non-catalytic subunit [Nocardioides sp. T2.26MG-1]CAI9408727.1 D-tagatose-1,6-bisphosphate aldolase subunit KbaZ [Nocardioides sp. T2.26MG-1]
MTPLPDTSSHAAVGMVADSDPAAGPLLDLLRRHRRGAPVGVTAVCSAHPLVLRAAAEQAAEDGSVLLVEATSNQVDQFGGYTGMLPEQFRGLVLEIAAAAGVDAADVVLGGDHLGPQVWRHEGADPAMAKAEDLVRAYVAAGYTKIHLDCSMPCSDDPLPLTDEVVARRAARLARVAEDTARTRGTGSLPVYVIGTEVPVPGGAHELIDSLTPTSLEAARTTLAAHRDAFEEAGVGGCWPRVVGLVVQPGVEFDAHAVFDYEPARTTTLRRVVDEAEAPPSLVLEAHSTDYQTPDRLAALVSDHWAILKVGPGLTFALREALFALATIEDELVPADRRSHLVAVVARAMADDPHWWAGYYQGDETDVRIARTYSYSDRMRYYWATPEVAAATDRLLANLEQTTVPLTMVSAHLPVQYSRVRAGELSPDPRSLAVDRVRDVLRGYALACGPASGRDDPGSASDIAENRSPQ